jgi:ribonuclease HI
VDPDIVIYLDAGLKPPNRLAVAAVACTPEGEVLIEEAREAGEGTANVGEYRALSHAACLAKLVGARQPLFISDSQLVVQQINGFWAARGAVDSPLILEKNRCEAMLMRFDQWALKHVPRERNRRADWLVSNLLDHKRTLKAAPPVHPAELSAAGRPGWSTLPSSRKTPTAALTSE